MTSLLHTSFKNKQKSMAFSRNEMSQLSVHPGLCRRCCLNLLILEATLFLNCCNLLCWFVAGERGGLGERGSCARHNFFQNKNFACPKYTTVASFVEVYFNERLYPSKKEKCIFSKNSVFFIQGAWHWVHLHEIMVCLLKPRAIAHVSNEVHSPFVLEFEY